MAIRVLYPTVLDPGDPPIQGVPLGDNLWVPERFAVEVFPDIEGIRSVTITVAVEDRVPVCRSVTFDGFPHGGRVTASALRTFPLAKWVGSLTYALAEAETGDGSGSPPDWGNLPPTIPARFTDPTTQQAARKAATGRRRRLTPTLLAEVATVYGEDEAGAPTKAVAEFFSISHSTAATWVGKARAAGLLPATTPGKATAKEKKA